MAQRGPTQWRRSISRIIHERRCHFNDGLKPHLPILGSYREDLVQSIGVVGSSPFVHGPSPCRWHAALAIVERREIREQADVCIVVRVATELAPQSAVEILREEVRIRQSTREGAAATTDYREPIAFVEWVDHDVRHE